MEKQDSGEYIEVDVVFINYKESLSKSEPIIELEEIRTIDAENCDSNCLQTNFRDTVEGKSLSALFNWYVKRMKSFVRLNPNKQLRVTHWGVKSGDVNVFSFSGEFYPDLAHTYDRKTDYWFGTKMETANKQLILEYICTRKSRSKASKVKAQVAEEKKSKEKPRAASDPEEDRSSAPKCCTALKFEKDGRNSPCSSSSSSSDIVGEATLLDLDSTEQTAGPSNPEREETSPPPSPRVYEYFSESPFEMYKAFTKFLRSNSSSDEEEPTPTYVHFDYCNPQENQTQEEEGNRSYSYFNDDEKY